jgi:hypothetical protein
MAALNQTNLSYADWAKRLDPDGKVPTIVEILSETNEILEDAVVKESNGATSHRTTVRSGLPAGTWRRLNYGVQPEKSTTVQVDDSIGMLETYSEVDKSLADLNGNTNEFRLSEDMAFVEGLGQTFADSVFYGDTATNPERFMGFAPRFNDLSAANGGNIVDGGGTGSDNSSIWLVTWDDNICHFIFPKGQKAGLQSNDKGHVTKEDATKGLYEIYRTHYKWDVGLCVRDWRYVVRIANVDNSNLTKDASGSSADLPDLMSQAIEKLHSMGRGKPVFYMNRTLRSALRRQIKNSANVNITMDEVGGKHVMSFDGIPVRLTDALTSAEAQVT